MMKPLVIMLLIVCTVIPLGATSSLKELIEAYELEKWGYLSINGNLSSSYESTKNYNVDDKEDDDVVRVSQDIFRYGGGAYLRWHEESELRTTDYYIGVSGSYNNNDHQSSDSDSKRNYRHYSVSSKPTLCNRFYQPGANSYLVMQADALLFWYGDREYNDGDSYRASGFFGIGEAKVGVGLGRMREVTNVVRAQRMAQRLQAINGTTLTDEQILKLARWLEKQPAYDVAFNWYNNAADYHFWQDALADIGLEPLGYDQFLYLTQEARTGTLLTRKEGHLIEAGIIYRASETKMDERDISVWSDSTEYRDASSRKGEETGCGFFVNMEYNRNINNYNQIGFALPLEFLWFHDDEFSSGYDNNEDNYEYELDYTEFLVQPEASWLVQMTDRLGVTFKLSPYWQSTTPKHGDTEDLSGLNSRCTATYYLGNNVKLVSELYYNREDYHNDAYDNGYELDRNWGLSLQLQWRPVHKML